MSTRATRLRTLLDAGVPDSVGGVLREFGHMVILHREVLGEKSPDDVVCAAAIHNRAILVAIDRDMTQMAKRYGVTPRGRRFDTLNLIRLCCRESQTAVRLRQGMSLIEHEWNYADAKRARRLWVDVGDHFLRTHR